YVMGLSSLSLIVAALNGYFSRAIEFGIHAKVSEIYIVLASLCLASGLQNAALTSSSGSSVRTTHLTGVTTDLGLWLARLISLGPLEGKAHFGIQPHGLLAGTILSFIGGSVVGAGVFYQFQCAGFFVPAAIALFAAWQGRNAKHEAHHLTPVEP